MIAKGRDSSPDILTRQTAEIETLQKAQKNWSGSEKSELRRLHAAYARPYYEIECGLTEEGDPWCVVCDSMSGATVVHIARIGRCYTVVHSEKGISSTVVQIKTAIDVATQ
jgi:hypothetical protein